MLVLISNVELSVTEVLYILPQQGISGEAERSGKSSDLAEEDMPAQGEWRIRSTSSTFPALNACSERLTRMEEGVRDSNTL